MKFCALLILCFLTGCANAHPADFRDTALRLDLEGGGVCSGTAVATDVILTAQHCTDHSPIVAINGQPARALKIVKDGHDHVLVRVTMKFKKWARVGGSPLTGDRVRWVGMPAGLDRIYREGYVSRVYTTEIFIDAHGFNGDSGAGVFCSDGRLCGLISAGKVWTNGPFSFAVTVLYPVAFTRAQWKEIA